MMQNLESEMEKRLLYFEEYGILYEEFTSIGNVFAI